jgi:hypothetical protein
MHEACCIIADNARATVSWFRLARIAFESAVRDQNELAELEERRRSLRRRGRSRRRRGSFMLTSARLFDLFQDDGLVSIIIPKTLWMMRESKPSIMSSMAICSDLRAKRKQHPAAGFSFGYKSSLIRVAGLFEGAGG